MADILNQLKKTDAEIAKQFRLIEDRLSRLEGRATIESRLDKIEEWLSSSQPIASGPAQSADVEAAINRGFAELAAKIAVAPPLPVTQTAPIYYGSPIPVRGVPANLPPTMPGTLARSVVATNSSLPAAIPTALIPTYAPVTVRRGVTTSRGPLGLGILPKLFAGCYGGGDTSEGASVGASYYRPTIRQAAGGFGGT